MTGILPRTTVPDLVLPLVGGGSFNLSSAKPDNFLMLIFYRGLHCPLCKQQLNEIRNNKSKFLENGVELVAISMDSEERATKAREDWKLDSLTIAYGLPEAQARSFGLYLSHKREGSSEPDLFSEPGLFLVGPDQTLYAAAIQTMPFTRPPVDQLLQAIAFINDKDYPARGEVA